METIRDHLSANRYVYDFRACSAGKGFAQVDTSQDASNFGTWANPTSLQIVTYCEGDVTLQTADDAAEFISEIRRIKAWNEENGHHFLGIDPMGVKTITSAFTGLGLGDLLH